MRFLKCCGFLALLAAGGCGRAPSDEAIATQIRAKFYADPLVKAANVTVEVNRGVVVLGGTANSTEVELQAFQLARGIEGVKRIRDQIAVSAAVERPQKAAFVSESAPPAAPYREREYPPVLPPPPEEIRVVRVEQPARESPPPPAPAESPVVVEVAAVDQAKPAALPLADPPASPVPSAAEPPTKPRPPQQVFLTAAGSASSLRLYQQWSAEYQAVDRNLQVRYQSIGSSAGMRQLTASHPVDFVVAEMPMKEERAALLRFPTAIRGLAVVCHLESGRHELNLSGEVLAAIYLGQVTHWDHPSIRALNPGPLLPAAQINVIHRSDANAASNTFVEFLSLHSSEWQSRFQVGPQVQWPLGVGAKGNEGMAAMVAETPYSIGYLEENYTGSNRWIVCALQNRAGKFSTPTPAALAAAAQNKDVQADFRVSFVDSLNKDAYPLSTFTWFYTLRESSERDKREALRGFLKWALTKGQADLESFAMVPLPGDLRNQIVSQISKLK